MRARRPFWDSSGDEPAGWQWIRGAQLQCAVGQNDKLPPAPRAQQWAGRRGMHVMVVISDDGDGGAASDDGDEGDAGEAGDAGEPGDAGKQCGHGDVMMVVM